MRQVQIQVRAADAARVVAIAAERGALQPAVLSLQGNDEVAADAERRLVLAAMPNDAVGGFIDAVASEVEDAAFLFAPHGVLPVETPLSDVRQNARRVVHLSTMELVLSALQSLGTWKGMLAYAVFSGLVAAYGVTLNASYLLTAAMLIAPMGAPAMVCVVATAVGDVRMFGRGALRFIAAVALLVVAAIGFGLAYGLGSSTPMMESVTSISHWTVLLALVGGAAGAQSQVQSERDSLVTGTATGFLIAVSLSPTSAVLGLGLVLGRWDYVGTMAFVIGLTFVGIVAGGMLALRIYDVTPDRPSLSRASTRGRTVLAAVMLALVVGAVAWQGTRTPGLLKADHAHEAITIVRDAVHDEPAAHFVSVTTSFSRPDLERFPQETLLLDVVVEQARPEANAQAVETAVRSAVRSAIRARLEDVTPLVVVTVLPASAPMDPPES